MKRNQLGEFTEGIGAPTGTPGKTEAKTKARPLPNNAMHAIDDAIMEASEALKELLPVLRGEREMRYILASMVDHLYQILLILKEVRKA